MAVDPNSLVLTQIGDTGLEKHEGLVLEEPLAQLRGYRWFKIIKEMSENDPIIGVIFLAVEMLMRDVKWTVEKGQEGGQAERARVFVEQCLFEDMSHTWQSTLSEIMTMLAYGWSYFEIVYKIRQGYMGEGGESSKYDDRRIGWRKWLPISQDSFWRWEFDDSDGGLSALTQQVSGEFDTRTIPIRKSLLFRTTSKRNNPEGRSMLRSAYTSYYYKSQMQRIQAIGIERDLAGLPIAWVPPNLLSKDATQEEQAVLEAIQKIAVNVRRDEQEAIIFPMMYDEHGNKIYDFTLLTSPGDRQFDIEPVIQRYDVRMALAIMADFLLLGHERYGSFALIQAKTSFFKDTINAWLDEISGVVNDFAITRLMLLNGFDLKDAPKLVHEDIHAISLVELGSFIDNLAQAGAPLFENDASGKRTEEDDELLKTLLRVAKLPYPQNGIAIQELEARLAERRAEAFSNPGGEGESE